MKKQIVHLCDPGRPAPEVIDKAVRALAAGGLIVFPTDTVYGLAVDPSVQGTVEKLFEAKDREKRKSVVLFAGSLRRIQKQGAELSSPAMKLAKRFWPGPLTLVVRQGADYIGYRIPDHAVPLAILKKTRGLLAVTSANKSGKETIETGQEALAVFGDRVDLILDAGVLPSKTPSTVVKVVDDGVEILRSGVISSADMESILKKR